MRKLVQMLTYMAILGVVVILPHWVAYTLVPEYSYGAIAEVFPACITEDSTNCYWDANVQGNGTGNSFIDVNGTAYYVR